MIHHVSRVLNRSIQVGSATVVLASLVIAGLSASAARPLDAELNQAVNAILGPGTKQQDAATMVALIIQIFMGFLATNFVISIMYAGFNWMNAGGEEKKVEEARNRTVHGAIGILIVVSFYVLTNFVLTQFINAATGK